MSRITLLIATLLLIAVVAVAAVGRPEKLMYTSFASHPVVPISPKVKLAVVVVFDQMRGDYVDRWRPLFPEGGFKRIQTDGAWFTACHYPYASTFTGPGHSAILSGATLDKTGIINNEWYDRKAGSQVICVGTDRYQTVGSTKPPAATNPLKKTGGNSSSPDRMMSPTVGDVLKAATDGQGKVFGLSIKDRSAILPTGKRADGAYWFGANFVTSTYYRDTLPRWAAEFNASKFADQWYDEPWTKFRSDLDYEVYSGRDKQDGEGDRYGLGKTFPHPMTGTPPKDGSKPTFGKPYYEALSFSPFGNELLLQFAKQCIEAEKLGRHESPDLLVVSFSSNDLVGHTFGPDSQEVLDVTLRADRIVADLMAFLDNRVGDGNYSMVITADHGICPIPEVSKAKGLVADRVMAAAMITGAELALRAKYGLPSGGDAKVSGEDAAKKGNPGQWIEYAALPNIYLNERRITERKMNKAEIADTLAEYLRKQSAVARVLTSAEIAAASTEDEFGQMVKQSCYPDRSGDAYVILQPYHYFSAPGERGTTHGSPYLYDRHVPLMVYGPGAKGGEKSEPVMPQHTAAITAYFLGVTTPRDAICGVPMTLLGK